MAWTAPATATVGQILTAAFMNTQLRDNMLQTAPALVTTDGDMLVATAANTLKRLAAFSGDVLLQELGAWELDISALTTNDTVGGASAGVAEIKVPVTQAEAEAGTNTRFSLWSSQRVKQAIDALSGVTQATQAEAEAESNVNKYLPPDLIRHSPGIAKGWAQIATAGTLNSPSHNVASITDTGTGDRTVVWDTDFSGSVYSAHASTNEDSTRAIRHGLTAYASGSVQLTCRQSDDGAGGHQAGALVDERGSIVAFGDHA